MSKKARTIPTKAIRVIKATYCHQYLPRVCFGRYYVAIKIGTRLFVIGQSG
jgi:hypothetical protein